MTTAEQVPDDGDAPIELRRIGVVSSAVHSLSESPRQGDEAQTRADIVVDASVVPALDGIGVGDRLVVLTWLHRADRSVLHVHPRGDVDRPLTGVFATRSPDRPNPIGLHEVTVVGVDGATIGVEGLEAVHGTPVVDLKPVLGPVGDR